MEPIVEVSGGKIQGRTTTGVSAFLGVPYAAAPIGLTRFLAPRPVVPWDGIRTANALGPTCIQPSYPPGIEEILGTYTVPGAEYLNVNVWTPDPGGSGLPVMVWIHGGAFEHGSNAVPAYDGAAFARDGVVLVSVNYRLGISGFAVLDGGPANRGLLDQLYALAWVQDNIAAFGGDPANVTVFGESAGAMSVAALLSAPAARGLFGRAIMQSGNGSVAVTADDARLMSAELAKRLEITPTAEAFAMVKPADLLTAQQSVHAEFSLNPDPARWGASVVAAGGGVMNLMPTLDGELLSALPIDAITAGSARGIPLIIGVTAEEFRLFTVPTGLAAAATTDMLPFLLARFGIEVSVAEAFAAARPDDTPGDVLAAVITDGMFRRPTAELAAAHAATGTPAYVYEFGWQRTDGELGACHGLEVPFVFDTLADAVPLAGPHAPQRLADEIHSAWIAFATTGEPGWEQYSADHRAVMRFGDPRSELVTGPAGGVWSTEPFAAADTAVPGAER
ncbi:carboxylesterase/lipase family protein [Nocardia sp. NBC_01388]|uniref:carboxylesterase/lipase family protein n=1 Tax=Nocardia sp. NBC_01388 TaxID=2903596 RepID=UPI0032491248